MNNKQIEKVFKIQLINLFDDLLIVFKQDTFLLELKTQAIKKINEENIFIEMKEYFNKDIEKYILEKNDKIVLEKNYSFVPTTKKEIIKFKLSKYWNIMSNTNKDKVWDYLNIFLQLYKNME